MAGRSTGRHVLRLTTKDNNSADSGTQFSGLGGSELAVRSTTRHYRAAGRSTCL